MKLEKDFSKILMLIPARRTLKSSGTQGISVWGRFLESKEKIKEASGLGHVHRALTVFLQLLVPDQGDGAALEAYIPANKTLSLRWKCFIPKSIVSSHGVDNVSLALKGASRLLRGSLQLRMRFATENPDTSTHTTQKASLLRDPVHSQRTPEDEKHYVIQSAAALAYIPVL